MAENNSPLDIPPSGSSHPPEQEHSGTPLDQQTSGDVTTSHHGSPDQQPPDTLQEYYKEAPTGPPVYDTQPPPYTFEQNFAIPKPKYHDLWATIIFVADMLGLVVVSGITLAEYKKDEKDHDRSAGYETSTFEIAGAQLVVTTLIAYGFALLLALGVSAIYIGLVRSCTKKLIYITGTLNSALFLFWSGFYPGAIALLAFSIFYAICFWAWRYRIPFSVLMLETALEVSRTVGHIFWVSALGGLATMITGAWFIATLIGLYTNYLANLKVSDGQEPDRSTGKFVGLVVFVVFSFYWLSEVIKTAMHVCVSGVYGTWYFYSRYQVPSHPTIGAFKRAMTFLFGPICFGSLAVSIIQVLKQTASIMQHNYTENGNACRRLLWSIGKLILKVILWMLVYFNHYAYSYIALYGEGYIEAAKATWSMMEDRGLDALVNDCLLDPVLTLGAIFVGYLCAFTSFFLCHFSDCSFRFSSTVAAFAFLMGLLLTNVFLVPIKTGIATIFTCMAIEPQVMKRDHPELYDRMLVLYPKIQAMTSTAGQLQV